MGLLGPHQPSPIYLLHLLLDQPPSESPPPRALSLPPLQPLELYTGCSCCCRRQRKGCNESTCEYHQGTGPHLPPHPAHLFPTSWEEGCDLGSPAPCPVLRKALNPCLRSYGPRYLLLWYHSLLSLLIHCFPQWSQREGRGETEML